MFHFNNIKIIIFIQFQLILVYIFKITKEQKVGLIIYRYINSIYISTTKEMYSILW